MILLTVPLAAVCSNLCSFLRWTPRATVLKPQFFSGQHTLYLDKELKKSLKKFTLTGLGLVG